MRKTKILLVVIYTHKTNAKFWGGKLKKISFVCIKIILTDLIIKVNVVKFRVPWNTVCKNHRLEGTRETPRHISIRIFNIS
jgi:hypothetical protein